MLAQKKMPDGQKEEISQVGPFLSVENLKYFDFFFKNMLQFYIVSTLSFTLLPQFPLVNIGFCLPVFQTSNCPFSIYD